MKKYRVISDSIPHSIYEPICVLYELIPRLTELESASLTGQMALGQINLMIAKKSYDGRFDVDLVTKTPFFLCEL